MAWSPHLIDPDQLCNRLCRAAPCLARRRDDWQPQVGLPRPGHRLWIPTRPTRAPTRELNQRLLGSDQPAPCGVGVRPPAAWQAACGRALTRGLDPARPTPSREEQRTPPDQPGRLDRPRSFRDDLRDRTGPKLHGMQGVKPRRTWLSFHVLDHAAGPVPRVGGRGPPWLAASSGGPLPAARPRGRPGRSRPANGRLTR